MNPSAKKWATLPFSVQILNIAADLIRAEKRDDAEEIRISLESALDLLSLTIANADKFNKKWELCRLHEALASLYSKLPKFDSAVNQQLLRALLIFSPESSKRIENLQS